MGRQRPRWEDDNDDDIREEFDFVDDEGDDEPAGEGDSAGDTEKADDAARGPSGPGRSRRRAGGASQSANADMSEPRRKEPGRRPRPGRPAGPSPRSRGGKEPPPAESAEAPDGKPSDPPVSEGGPGRDAGATPGGWRGARNAPPERGPRREPPGRSAFDDSDRDDEDDDEPLEGLDAEMADEGIPESDELDPVDAIEEEPEVDDSLLPPDNQDAIRALRELGARVDVNERGRVWRIFLYERNKDNALAQIHGFPRLKEVWLLGSRVSKEMVDRLREIHPELTIYV